MSLINDALKKAQNLQTRPPGTTPGFPRAAVPENPLQPAAPAPTGGLPAPASSLPVAAATPVAALRKGKSPHSGLIITITASILVVGLGAIGYVVYALFFMESPSDQLATATPPPAATTTVLPATPAAAPAPDAAAAADATSAARVAAPAEAAPAVPAPAAAIAPATPDASRVTTAAPAPASAPAATSAAAMAEVSADPADEVATEEEFVGEHINNPAPHIQQWVEKITVAGIRAGDNPKALMNDRVYLIGDTVSHDLALKLKAISERLLVFEDADGNTYEYTF